MRDKNPVIHMIHDNFTVSNKSFIVEQWFEFVIERYESCMKHFYTFLIFDSSMDQVRSPNVIYGNKIQLNVFVPLFGFS